MDWIHCNVCFNQPRNSGPGFVLTSCGHIFCGRCESRDNVDQCKSCKSQCSVVKLSANMSPEVRPYFEDPEESVKKLLQTIRFQKNHRFNLFKAHQKRYEKYLLAKSHIRKLEAQVSAAKRKLEQLEKSEASVTRQVRQTPEVRDFVFTPDINRKPTPVFNSIASQNSAQSAKPNFSFRLPDIHAYQQYRNGIQNTPNISPAESTPRNNSANINQKKSGPSPLRGQSKFPMRTPPYNDFQGMRITGRKY